MMMNDVSHSLEDSLDPVLLQNLFQEIVRIEKKAMRLSSRDKVVKDQIQTALERAVKQQQENIHKYK